MSRTWQLDEELEEDVMEEATQMPAMTADSREKSGFKFDSGDLIGLVELQLSCYS